MNRRCCSSIRGGPFWRNKDEGAWSIPKGEFGEGEDALVVARREFAEELGLDAPPGEYRALSEVKQRGGKIVTAFAVEGDLEVSQIKSNTFEIEWLPKSGKHSEACDIQAVDSDAARPASLG